jgi:hypothetical protein
MEEKIDVKSKKKEEESTKILVVAQLPTQPTNRVKDDAGVEYTLVTQEEALTEMLEILKQLKKGLL